MHAEPSRTLSLPSAPEERSGTPPSLLAFLAPVVGSLVLWAVTGSPMSLAFAALGPVLLIGGMLDARWRLRRDRRRDERRFAQRLAELDALIDELHANERQSAGARTPTAREWAGPSAAAHRWRAPAREPLLVTVGRAAVPSSLRLTPERTGPEPPAVERVRAKARLVQHAPLPVDLRRGLCVLGNGAAADALFRSVLLQALSRIPPTGRVEVAGQSEAWLASLPHGTEFVRPRTDSAVRIALDDGGAPARMLRVSGTSGWPSECDTVVQVAAGEGRVLRHPGGTAGSTFTPDAVSAVEALALARALAVAAAQTGAGIPDSVRVAPLLTAVRGHSTAGTAASLRCPVGVGAGGTVEIDLVADGPHAVIGGTTGSGKSELLRAWVLGLASLHPPSAVQFLLLDFKGGAAFAELEGLPHTVGVLTDLNPGTVRRAIASIRAELTHRERALASAGARAIGEGGSGLSRLVLVIDEFAALAEQLPECHAVLGDVAARGRSLGVHLILCTQRPAGVVRDALLANAGLRICLRVTSEEDSRAVVGVPDAARLVRPGRAILVVAGSPAVQLQVGEAESGLPAAIRGAWAPAPVRRPWLPELPVRIDPAALPAGKGLVFALADRPEEQAQPPAAWDPRRHGGLLVLGGPGSGRSTALAAVAAAAGAPSAIWPRPTLPCVWDAVAQTLGKLEAGEPEPQLLLLDDVDAVLAAARAEYGHELAERLLRILREGASAGVWVALTAARIPAALGPATALAGGRLLLRAASRDDHLLAGGTPATFDPAAPPGRGELGGTPVQVALARRGTPPPPEESVRLAPLPGLLAVSSRPAALEPLLGGASVQRLGGLPDLAVGGAGAVLIGTPDEWQVRWSALRQLSSVRPVLFDGCGPAEVRSLLGRQELPPPSTGRARWLFRPAEPAVRVRLADET